MLFHLRWCIWRCNWWWIFTCLLYIQICTFFSVFLPVFVCWFACLHVVIDKTSSGHKCQEGQCTPADKGKRGYKCVCRTGYEGRFCETKSEFMRTNTNTNIYKTYNQKSKGPSRPPGSTPNSTPGPPQISCFKMLPKWDRMPIEPIECFPTFQMFSEMFFW